MSPWDIRTGCHEKERGLGHGAAILCADILKATNLSSLSEREFGKDAHMRAIAAQHKPATENE
jgi:hypothetical protein